MSNTIFGIDLGTNNIKIFNQSDKKILNEKNVIAIINKNQLFAYGDAAYEMHEKAPGNILVTFPVHFGVIADYKNMQILLIEFLKKASKTKLKNAEFIIAVPTDITEVEKKAFHDIVKSCGIKCKDVLIAEKPVADAIGIGLDIKSATGTLVVDMGADTTEISVLSLGGIVLSQLIHLGGNKLDESVISYIKKTHGIDIGKKTACALKETIGSAIKLDEPETMVAYGRDIVTGLPIEITIDSDLVYEAIKENLNSIVNNIKIILERTPPELSADIINHGVYLTGGGSLIKNIDVLLEQELKIKVNTCETPSESVVKGLMQMATDSKYRPLAYTMKVKIYN
ncbi:rod shape-determining protein MreB [Acetitomaculum ruminis DSM 5522]|uniref:Cell shape-determining protein MreB n=1 Tax=Acetitomaculum ruminis DSM 5522 TaxID=1120918 RepID=A0A1I0V4Z9_9FIRM|nr:rod shape-determining protein [Acetitomaculum ruminis]SFA71361.1 rod shape-determining protein MreB [Acetitomaculum ruminis DSM 5522]